MLRERGKDRKRERGRESLLRRIGVKLWQEKEVGGEQKRGEDEGEGGKENRVQTGRNRRSGREGGRRNRSKKSSKKNRRERRRRCRRWRQLVR